MPCDAWACLERWRLQERTRVREVSTECAWRLASSGARAAVLDRTGRAGSRYLRGGLDGREDSRDMARARWLAGWLVLAVGR